MDLDMGVNMDTSLFSALDADNDGKIDEDELREFLRNKRKAGTLRAGEIAARSRSRRDRDQ